jgi:hypothetical protein
MILKSYMLEIIYVIIAVYTMIPNLLFQFTTSYHSLNLETNLLMPLLPYPRFHPVWKVMA